MGNRSDRCYNASMTILKLTDEQRQALLSAPSGQPIELHDDVTDQSYLLVAAQDIAAFWREYALAEIDRGLDAIDRGEIVEWDPERLKAKARAAVQGKK